MKFDVSEMKVAQDCSRKWQLSSRNAFHLKPRAPKPNLHFGTVFHECLASLYLGADPDKVVDFGVGECLDIVQEKVMRNMVEGYIDNILEDDLEEYDVLDIEHSVGFYLPEFFIPGNLEESIKVVGSIDMIAVRKADNVVFGFEHKTCAKFRTDLYNMVDEQPRVYFLELLKYVEELNKFYPTENFTLGGIFINEVQKVQRKFSHKRTLCNYTPAECAKFYQKLLKAAGRIQALTRGDEQPTCEPGYMTCQMCDYAEICGLYGYEDVEFDVMMEEFAEEFAPRDTDHLDEKLPRGVFGNADSELLISGISAENPLEQKE